MAYIRPDFHRGKRGGEKQGVFGHVVRLLLNINSERGGRELSLR